jgi:hypothetical protein
MGAIAALVLFGAAPVLEIVHLCVVEHSTCPVDGELVDAARIVTHIHDVDAPGLHEGTGQTSTENHAHHHCTAETRRASPTGRSVSGQHRVAAEERAPQPTADLHALALAGAPILLIAPKASPPV